jgi:hypothetical protein
MSKNISRERLTPTQIQQATDLSDAEIMMVTSLGTVLYGSALNSSRFRKTRLGLYVFTGAANDPTLQVGVLAGGMTPSNVEHSFVLDNDLRTTFIKNDSNDSSDGDSNVLQEAYYVSPLTSIRRFRVVSAAMPGYTHHSTFNEWEQDMLAAQPEPLASVLQNSVRILSVEADNAAIW